MIRRFLPFCEKFINLYKFICKLKFYSFYWIPLQFWLPTTRVTSHKELGGPEALSTADRIGLENNR